MTNTLSTNEQLIVETKELWNQIKLLVPQIALRLIKIRDSDAWRAYGHKTFQQFVAEELDIHQSQCSRLEKIGDTFLGEYTPEQIGAISEKKLYAAARLDGPLEERLACARTWSDDDYKQHKAEVQPHAFVEVCYCKTCGLSKDRHP